MSENRAYQIALARIEKAKQTKAVELNLAGLGLENLPPEIGQLTSLTSLDLSLNQLIGLPSEISRLTHLASLDFGSNQLTTSLPQVIAQLTSLTSLDLSLNQLTSLPPVIGRLTRLTSLDLSYNQLAILPEKIGQLTRLTLLYLGHNKLMGLPAEVGHLAHLTSLDLSNNILTSLSREIGQLTSLTSLELRGNGLTILPPEIGKLTNLASLDLANNKLTSLLPEIGRLTNLVSLELTNNQLTSLPPEIGRLTNLVSLEFANNQLTSLPPEIGRLTRLTLLNLGNNRLTTLPQEIGKLTQLTSLDLSVNLLTNLSPEIGKLIRLEKLDVSNHNWLRLAGENRIQTLPREILQLQSLKWLDFNNNVLDIPPEILEKVREPHIILGYLSKLWDGQRRPLAETKMLVVGQGSVGKTSLIRCLTGGLFNSSENKTDGIAIHSWQVKNKSSIENQKSKIDTIRVNIWDFGGQEIMHATHQFFLTRRSLYLLVLDARLTQEENRVEYWLKIIQSFGGESPVLLVGNKTDQHSLDIDRTGLQKKYPNIIGVIETSAATGIGLDTLKAAVTNQINDLPHVHDALPEAWFNVKNRLEDLGRNQNYISQEKYIETCAAGQVRDSVSQRTLIGFLHDLGIVLHFQDDPRLEALGILNPEWVTNGVYKILNAHSLFQNKGVLPRPMLADILPEDIYPANKRLFIIDMMRKFELCYDLEPDQTFLVPDLLPKDEPFTGEWNSALAFQIHYNVLPSSIISRFIVRMNSFIHRTIWRAGVVLKKDENIALIKADIEDRKIFIWINGTGNTRRDFLAAIRAEFEAIHKTIIKIEAREKVPVPGQDKVAIDLEHLLLLEQKGIMEYLPEGMKELIDVRRLLNGVSSETEQQYRNISVYVGGNMMGNLTVGDENIASI